METRSRDLISELCKPVRVDLTSIKYKRSTSQQKNKQSESQKFVSLKIFERKGSCNAIKEVQHQRKKSSLFNTKFSMDNQSSVTQGSSIHNQQNIVTGQCSSPLKNSTVQNCQLSRENEQKGSQPIKKVRQIQQQEKQAQPFVLGKPSRKNTQTLNCNQSPSPKQILVKSISNLEFDKIKYKCREKFYPQDKIYFAFKTFANLLGILRTSNFKQLFTWDKIQKFIISEQKNIVDDIALIFEKLDNIDMNKMTKLEELLQQSKEFEKKLKTTDKKSSTFNIVQNHQNQNISEIYLQVTLFLSAFSSYLSFVKNQKQNLSLENQENQENIKEQSVIQRNSLSKGHQMNYFRQIYRIENKNLKEFPQVNLSKTYQIEHNVSEEGQLKGVHKHIQQSNQLHPLEQEHSSSHAFEFTLANQNSQRNNELVSMQRKTEQTSSTVQSSQRNSIMSSINVLEPQIPKINKKSAHNRHHNDLIRIENNQESEESIAGNGENNQGKREKTLTTNQSTSMNYRVLPPVINATIYLDNTSSEDNDMNDYIEGNQMIKKMENLTKFKDGTFTAQNLDGTQKSSLKFGSLDDLTGTFNSDLICEFDAFLHSEYESNCVPLDEEDQERKNVNLGMEEGRAKQAPQLMNNMSMREQVGGIFETKNVTLRKSQENKFSFGQASDVPKLDSISKKEDIKSKFEIYQQ